MSGRDRLVLWTLQALVFVLPFWRGGNHPMAAALVLPIALALLVVTLHARQRVAAESSVPGVGALAAFAVLALFTTVPLPPLVLRWLEPTTFRLYTEMLPGWPDAGAWSTWRTLAIDPYGVWVELGRLAAGFALFAVVVAYPWTAAEPGDDAYEDVLARMLATALVAGALFSALALLQQIAGDGSLFGVDAESGRISGPFVNPNHFAAWLEMLIPAALAYLIALAARLRRRLAAAAAAGRSMGVRPRRAWVAALIAHQRRLWPPLSAATALVLMTVAHATTGSRGGTAALLVGCAVAGAGILASTRRRDVAGMARPWLPAALALTFVLTSAIVVVLWAQVDGDETVGTVTDVSLQSRLAVAEQGLGIVHDHALWGTGLGSWLHAFRPYQAPPVEGGIWDHAHNDYLELAADGGVAALIIACMFAFAVVRAARATPEPESERSRRERTSGDRPPGFERPEWRAAFGERTYLRWGLAGGLAAILVHSFVEFALHMPANFLALMMLAALLIVSARPRRDTSALSSEAAAPDGTVEPLQLTGPAIVPRPEPALALLLAAFTVVTIPQVANYGLSLADAAPFAPRTCLERADIVLAEGTEGADARASALVRRALDRSPADREAHEALAAVLGPGADGDAPLRRAIALEPWSVTVRDELALRLWSRDERVAAARELEESMFRFPYLVSHAYLDPESDGGGRNARQLLRALADGDTVALRVADLEPEMAEAVEHGLRRARDLALAGGRRAGIVRDLVIVLEARERFADAADLLRAEAAREVDDGSYLAHAAHDYLRAHDIAAAEETLLAALLHRPEEGILYRRLAVDVYAARGDFETAQTVLKAAERNAVDLLPVYRAVTEVLGRREAARQDELVQAIALDSHREGAARDELEEDPPLAPPVVNTIAPEEDSSP